MWRSLRAVSYRLGYSLSYAGPFNRLLEELLQLVGPHIERRRTHRIPIGPKERSMMTIR